MTTVLDLPLEVLFHILDYECESDSEAVLVSNASKKWWDVVHEWRKPKTTFDLVDFGFSRTILLLQWAREHGCPPFDSSTFTRPACEGNIEVIKWLRSQGCLYDKESAEWAAERGQLETLKFMIADGCPVEPIWTFVYTVRSGQLKVLKWMRSQGYAWDEFWTCVGAAEKGHLEVLKWLRSEGCPWDKSACLVRAEQNKHLDVVNWIKYC